ncbi:MAG: biotin--[acetyl-CoA-carboxylase] ligase [Alphaproteobacteria bacterium]|nr:biotin--[acetyl-CoA-carboxylase] ligase [Alphaproteobacteria bacterium]
MTNEKWKIVCFEEVGSTNDVAQQYSSQGVAGKTVIRALSQTAGRGRRGRSWQSLQGNLFFSLLLEFAVEQSAKLVLASSLSVLETVKKFSNKADVCLKWPNDVLLNGAKVCGILLEKGAGKYMIIGIGVNVKQSPKSGDLLYPTTSLAEANIEVTPEDFLESFLADFDKNLQREFAELREIWLKYATGVGKEIAVRQNGKDEKGIFCGIDENGNLLLQNKNGLKKIMAGDVFFIEKKDE